MCHMSGVMCQVSGVRCQESGVIFVLAQSVGASCWRAYTVFFLFFLFFFFSFHIQHFFYILCYLGYFFSYIHLLQFFWNSVLTVLVLKKSQTTIRTNINVFQNLALKLISTFDVTCHLSHFMCHLSLFSDFIFFSSLDKGVELVDRGSVINMAFFCFFLWNYTIM